MIGVVSFEQNEGEQPNSKTITKGFQCVSTSYELFHYNTRTAEEDDQDETMETEFHS